MIKLNLLKYFDKSFSEIYQIEHGEIEETVSKDKTKRVRNHILTLFYLLAFVLVLFAGYFTYKLFQNPKKIVKTKTKLHKISIKNQNKNNKLKKSSKKFIKIAEIKIVDKPNNNGNFTAEKLNKNLNYKKSKPKINKPKKSNRINKKVKQEKVKQVTNSYNLILYKVRATYFNKLKSLVNKYNLKIKQIKKYKAFETIWKVYVVYPSSSKYIAGRPVKYLRYFKNKNSAILYVKEKKLKKAIIKKDKIVIYLYNLSIYPIKNKKLIERFVKITSSKNYKLIKTSDKN